MSRSTSNRYQWKIRTEEGEKREVEAQLFGGNWTFRSRLSTRRTDESAEWTLHEHPSKELLEQLESTLFDKYQRKHASYDLIQGVRKLIAEWKPRMR